MLGYLFVLQIWSAISCYYNDFQIYNVELFRYTHESYASSRLVLFYVTFNIGFWLMGRSIGKKAFIVRSNSIADNKFMETMKTGILLMWVGVVIYIFYSWTTNGFQILSGIHKYESYQSLDFFGKLLSTYSFLLLFMLGAVRPQKKGVHWADIFITIYLIYLLSLGHKFSTLFESMVYFSIAIFAKLMNRNSHLNFLNPRIFVSVVLCLIALLMYSLSTYMIDLGSYEDALELLLNRLFAFQGHLWWAVDNDVIENGLYDQDHWFTELREIFFLGSEPSEDTGMRYLMVNILGYERASRIFDAGYLYTMAYPAILIATFYYPVALLIQLSAGMLFFLFLYYLNNKIVRGQLILAMLAITIIYPYMTALVTGNFIVFAGAGVLSKVLLTFMIEFFYYKKKNAHNPIHSTRL